MSLDDLVLQKNIHIVPFSYPQDYAVARAAISGITRKSSKGNEVTSWLQDISQPTKLYQYVGNQFSSSQENMAVCTKFNLSKDKLIRADQQLPRDVDTPIKLISNNKEIGNLTIRDIGIYLFDLHVGFITIDLKVESNKTVIDEILKEIVEVNYYFKKFEYSNYYLEFTDKYKKSKDETVEETTQVVLKDWIQNIVLLDGITYFNNNGPDYSYPFINFCVKSKLEKDKLEEYLFYLRHSFKDTYLSNEKHENDCNEIYQPFDYMYWGISTDACCGIQYFVDDNTTNKFLEGLYYNNSTIDENYLKVILLIQFWKYASIQLTDKLQKLYLDESICNQSVNAPDLCSINQLREQFTLFRLKSFFSEASRVSQINQFFKKLKEIHGINDIMEDTNEVLSTLDFKVNLIQERQLAVDREAASAKEKVEGKLESIKKEKTERLVFSLTLIFATIQALSSAPGINEITKSSFHIDLSSEIIKAGNISITGYICLTLGIFIIYLVVLLLYRKK